MDPISCLPRQPVPPTSAPQAWLQMSWFRHSWSLTGFRPAVSVSRMAVFKWQNLHRWDFLESHLFSYLTGSQVIPKTVVVTRTS